MKNLFDIELKKHKSQINSNNTKLNKNIKKKTVLIGTPSLDGTVSVWYSHSLAKTIHLCRTNDIIVVPLFICNESIIHMARNELIKFAYEGDYDSLVFIDGDQSWDPNYFLKLVQSEKNAIALPVCLKQDTPKFNFRTFSNLKDVIIDDKTGEFTIPQVGTGFFKLSSKLIKDLWHSSETIQFRDQKLKFIFDFSIDNMEYVGEDYTLCKKIRELGYNVWINTNSTCGHVGEKKYSHNFKEFINKK